MIWIAGILSLIVTYALMCAATERGVKSAITSDEFQSMLKALIAEKGKSE